MDETATATAAMAVGQLRNFAKAGRKIAGAGMNYKALLPILKVDAPKEPVIFLKPSTSYITEGQRIVIPKGFAVNEEIELGVVIGKGGKNIEVGAAMDHVGGYCVALDMTATSELTTARSAGLPWCIGKGFDTACPVSRFIEKSEITDPHKVQLWCTVNGQPKQKGNTDDLIFDVPQLISFVSRYMTLEPNDLILTGSPPGMGPVHPGDTIEGGIEGLLSVKFAVTSE
ncbi:PREDICTED: acylpyruvase FAHD1, mitochondrial [Nicrophorus vespilloides]|uniref:oxaloacetate tautomerase n=1 Tax=Nicrophorus vespilloides TaxID=110193 RepID=A0ABM1N000_NICVS|nr:PREDICTED: acylpyruvase FAHD1, mitochondrial [Nicrophorus vespilloides]